MDNIVIAAKYVQFVVWCRDTERNQNEYKWVCNATGLHGLAPGTKVTWLTPWTDTLSPAALERYDELVVLVKACQLDVEYVNTHVDWNS